VGTKTRERGDKQQMCVNKGIQKLSPTVQQSNTHIHPAHVNFVKISVHGILVIITPSTATVTTKALPSFQVRLHCKEVWNVVGHGLEKEFDYDGLTKELKPL
jgi:hypothetical protein